MHGWDVGQATGRRRGSPAPLAADLLVPARRVVASRGPRAAVRPAASGAGRRGVRRPPAGLPGSRPDWSTAGRIRANGLTRPASLPSLAPCTGTRSGAWPRPRSVPTSCPGARSSATGTSATHWPRWAAPGAAERLAGLTEEDAALLLATALECRLARGDVGEALALGDAARGVPGRPGRAGAARPPRGRRALRGPGRGRHRGPALRGGRRAAGGRCGRRASWCRGGSGRRAQRGPARAPRRGGRPGPRAARAGRRGSPAATALALRTLAATEAGGDRGRAAAPGRGDPRAAAGSGRLAAQVDTDLAGLLLLAGDADARSAPRPSGCCAGPRSTPAGTSCGRCRRRVRGLLERAGEPPRRGAARCSPRSPPPSAGWRAGRRGADQPGDRRPARRERQGRRVAPLPRLPQARHPLPGRARAHARRRVSGRGRLVGWSSRYAGGPPLPSVSSPRGAAASRHP